MPTCAGHGLPAHSALPGAERVDAADTVDLVESERMIRALIADGVDAIALNGTLGECATLTLEEWKAFAAASPRPSAPSTRASLSSSARPRSTPAIRSRGCGTWLRPRHHRHPAGPPDVGRHGARR